MAEPIQKMNIGGIDFNQKEVLGFKKVNDNCMSGSLFTVETTHGTFSFREFPNSAIKTLDSEENTRSIFGGTVKNCNLEKLVGTENKDIYHMYNSSVNTLDLSGDEGNKDRVYSYNETYIGKRILDSDDKITELKNKYTNVDGFTY